MKTIYINENVLKSKKLQESIYTDMLSSTLKDKIVSNKTILDDSISMLDIYDIPFLLKITEEGFIHSKNKLKDLLDLDEIKDKNLEEILSNLISECKELEKPYRSELERISYNYVIDLFNVPKDTVDIEVILCDEVNLDKESILLDPIKNDINPSIKDEIYKRRFLNALCYGGAMSYSSKFENYFLQIKHINHDLLTLYKKIIILNEYLLYTKENLEITEDNKMQMGTVEIHLGNDMTRAKIEAQGIITPVLITELIRGFMELFISHGLPKEKNTMQIVLNQSDFLKAEPWNMRFGPVLWEKFINTFNDVNSHELPYLLKRISQIKPEKLNILFKKIFMDEKPFFIEKIIKKVKHDIEYDEFIEKMDKLKSEKGIITDEYIHPDEL